MKAVFYHALTPMHIGNGTNLGLIDLPIQREAHTEFPVMPSSAIKGVIRASFEDEQKQNDIFGKTDEEGKVIFTDGKILLFPVKSLKGVFAWITSYYVLERFKRDTNIDIGDFKAVEKDHALVSSDKIVIKGNDKEDKDKGKLVLEEFTFNAEVNKSLTKLKQIIKCDIDQDKIAIVSDDVFKFFVKNYTEVNARIKIDQKTGTAQDTGLWYQELLPAETVFYGCIAPRKNGFEGQLTEVINKINNQTLQFGGDETLGRGLTKITVVGINNENP
jgi:CRISPR-associated protein Cmr4